MQKTNNITAIFPQQKGTVKRISDWFERNAKKFWDSSISFSYDVKDMPIDTSVNNIADFVLNRSTEESIELIQLINKEVENRFETNSEDFLKQSQYLKKYLKSKSK